MNWILYSILATFLLAVNFLLIKQGSVSNIPVQIITLYVWVIAASGLAAFMAIQGSFVPLNFSQILIVCGSGVAFLLGSLFLNYAVYSAPNPGYATAIGSAQIALVAVASVFLFDSSLTLVNTVGVAAVLIGVVLLSV